MKKLLLSLLFILVLTSYSYSQIPDHYHHFKRIDCELRPIKRTNRNTVTPLKPLIRIREDTSLNWSGYAVATNLITPQTGSVKNVSGSWVVPKLKSVKGNAYSSIWVGIDGFSSNTVEQIGTEQDWVNGEQISYAWFEMYPRNSFEIVNFPCSPGQKISAEVIYKGNGVFQLTIYNATREVYFQVPTSYTKVSGAKRNSAEWIVEAPSTNTVLPLSNFGTVQFTNCSTTVNGITGAINNGHWKHDPLTMETSGGIVKAQPSALSAGGTSFSVTWHHK